MRTKWAGNTALQALTRVVDRVGAAFAFVELLIAEAEHILQRMSQWDDADSIAGFDLTSDPGGVRLVATVGTQIERASSTGYQTAIDDRTYATAFYGGKIVWSGTEASDIEIMDVQIRLDPVRDGVPANKVVAFWDLHLYLGELVGDQGALQRFVEIVEPKRVTATGTAPADYLFDWAFDAIKPRPKAWGPLGNVYPQLYLVVRPLKADGSIAGNVGLATSNAVATVTDASGNVLNVVRMNDSGQAPGEYSEQVAAEVPRLRVRTPTGYPTATLTFTSNPLNLGSAPTATLEMVLEADTPGGSTVVGNIRNPTGPGAWLPFVDGDVVGVGTLATLPALQIYDVRFILTAGNATRITPTLRRAGVREMTSVVFRDNLRFETSGVSVDPITYRAEIEDVRIHMTRGGDQLIPDTIVQKLTQNHLGKLEVRIWWGHPDSTILARSAWMLLRSLDVLDYASEGARLTLHCRSPLARLRQRLPIVDPVTHRQEMLEYPDGTINTASEVYEDLLDRIGLPERYRGQGLDGVALGASSVANVLEDTDAKVEADALAAICGGVVAELQGRLSFIDLFGEHAIEAILPRGEITWGQVGPGFSQRIPYYRVSFGWDRWAGAWSGWARGFQADAIAKLDRAPLALEQLSDAVSRWLPVTSGAGTDADPYRSVLGEALADRMVEFFGAGAPFLPFTARSAWPELHVGSVIACEIDELVMRTVETDRAIYGPQWVIGMIIAEDPDSNFENRAFTLWARLVSDIVAETEAALRLGFALPDVLDIRLAGDEGGDGVISGDVSTAEAQSVRWASSTTDYPDDAAVAAGTLVLVSADGTAELGTLDTLANGETLYVSIKAYEQADGSGAASQFSQQARITRRAAETKILRFSPFQVVANGFDNPLVIDLTGDRVYPSGAAPSSGVGQIDVPMPIGVTITTLRARVSKQTVGSPGDTVSVFLFRDAGTLLATAEVLAGSGPTGASTQSDTLSETTINARYWLKLFIASQAVITDARVQWIEIEYDAPSYFETY